MNQLLLLCMIAGRKAAIAASEVRSVIEIEAFTPVPGAPRHIPGLTALRSQALTLIDCRSVLGFEPSEEIIGLRAAVDELNGQSYDLLLDEAHDVAQAMSAPEPVPGGFGEGWQNAATGMVETVEGPALVLDVERLIGGQLAQAA